jgi:hypothetical protein
VSAVSELCKEAAGRRWAAHRKNTFQRRAESPGTPKKPLRWSPRCAACLACLGACLAQSPPTAGLTKSDPIAYLNRALDEMQAHALRRESVDWPHVRAEAVARAAQAKTTIDTYAAIRFALASLGDHHSLLRLTPELEKLENASGHESAAEPPPASPFTGRYEPEAS